jgi:hypothetical protein
VLIDMRNLSQILAHDAELEIGEGPQPPQREGRFLQ